MKLIRSVGPISEKKRQEMERELQAQKERLAASYRRAAEALRNDLSATRWARRYPVEAAILIVVAGLFVAQLAWRRPRMRAELIGESRAA